MVAFSIKKSGKYFWIELIFLLFLCYFMAIISDVEYSYYEEGNPWNFTKALEFRLVYGTSNLAFYGLYYWVFLKPLLFKRKFFKLFLSVMLFIVAYGLFNKYEHWLITKITFISAGLRERALLDYQRTKINFVIAYIVGRILLTLFGLAYVIRSLQQDEEVKALKEYALVTELNYLKAQLQPHFFFNTLNNIYALAIKNSPDTGPMVAKLSQMMRYIIYDSGQSKVALEKEVDFLKNYIEIERIRRPDNIKISFDIQGDPNSCKVEPLLMLPLIENAFKHGIEDELESGFVNIVLHIDQNELLMQVENSKPSILGEKPGGVGLENMNKRLNLLYKGRYDLKIDDQDKYYLVVLTLQLS